MNMMAAPLTNECRLFRQAMQLRAAMTFRTARWIAESDVEQVRQADVVGGKTACELAENLGL